jgi:hypothetical protein
VPGFFITALTTSAYSSRVPTWDLEQPKCPSGHSAKRTPCKYIREGTAESSGAAVNTDVVALAGMIATLPPVVTSAIMPP